MRYDQEVGISGLPEITTHPIFDGSAFSSQSILEAARFMATGQTTSSPKTGSKLTVNSRILGNYDYHITNSTTISSFTSTDWFTSTSDTASAWIIIKGDLTIDLGQTIQPANRKLFTVVYVKGALTLDGIISMTARGANHSGTGSSGGFTAPVDISIGSGTFSIVGGGTISNPLIPSRGGSGGAATSTDNVSFNGSVGSNGGTGGGGGGGKAGGSSSGAGSAGTCFTGGTGGGGVVSSGSGTNGTANGGQGGNSSGPNMYGGGGNPGGTGSTGSGSSGTGGVLIVICEGSLTGSGSCEANGVTNTGQPGNPYGGSTGGGSLTILCGSNPSGVSTFTATGGSRFSVFANGAGGNGTARKLLLSGN